MDTVQGWHFAEQVKGLHIRLSLEKINTSFLFSSFEKGALSNLAPSTPFVRLTLTFYFENHTGLNVPSHKEKKTIMRPKVVWLVGRNNNKEDENKQRRSKRRQKIQR